MGTSTPRKYLMMGTRSTLKIPTPRLKVERCLSCLSALLDSRAPPNILYTTSPYPRRPILVALTMRTGNLLGHSYWGDMFLLSAYLCYGYTKYRTEKDIGEAPSKSTIQCMITCGFV